MLLKKSLCIFPIFQGSYREKITRNVIDILGFPGGKAILTKLIDIVVVGVAGFFSSNDNFKHAIVATRDGNVTEIFWNSQTKSQSNIGSGFQDIVGVAGYYSGNNVSFQVGFQHVILATNDGTLQRIFWNHQDPSGPRIYKKKIRARNFSNIVEVSGFYCDNDGFQHAIVGTTDGNVHELFFLQ